MKNYLLGFFALALAVAIVSFTAAPKGKYRATTYAVYDGSGAESSQSNYAIVSTRPTNCPGSAKLCFFRILSGQSFSTAFNAFDTDNDNLVSDQTEQAGILEKRSF